MNQNHSKKGTVLLVLGLLLIFAIISALSVNYVQLLQNTMEQEAVSYLKEVSEHLAKMVNYRVNATYKDLESIAETYRQLEPGKRQAYLESKLERYGFLSLGLCGLDGIATVTGAGTMDLSHMDFAEAVLQGKEKDPRVFSAPVSEGEVLLYVVPVYEEEQVAGMIMASTSKEKMREYLNVESFGGEGYSQLIDYSGDFILQSGNKNEVGAETNFFEMIEKRGKTDGANALETMKNNMLWNKTGSVSYWDSDGVRKIMTYISLDVRDWYLLSVVPSSVSGNSAQTFVQVSIVINVIIVLLFMALLIFIVLNQRKNKRELERIAYVDPVTKGLSRIRFEREVEELIRRAPAGTYAFVSLDIEKFKLINDSFGSGDGNRTLKYVYNTVVSHLKEGEVAARISADTFNLLLYHSSKENIQRRIEEIVQDINRFNTGLVKKYFLPINVGVYAVRDPEMNLIMIQDRATVARKNNRDKNKVHLCGCSFYIDSDRQRMVREKEIDNKIEEALNNEEFIIYLQPQIELGENKVAGAEALVRWQDPERGLVPPAEFIPILEKNGFIIKLDLYVFEQVCKVLKRWMQQGIPLVSISVNLSRAHLYDPKFLEPYQKIQEEYGVPAHLLEFELTETLVFENMETLVEMIGQIHKAGFTCSMDDFGSGYSSLNLLKDVPVDALKLDRAFFRSQSTENSCGEAVLESVIELAGKLHMTTIAEGVELESQVQFLRRAGCDMVQGFVFSKPLSVEEFEQYAFGTNNAE